MKNSDKTPLLKASGLRVSYGIGGGIFSRAKKTFNAVDGVNTRIMDSTSWSGMIGVQAEKGNFALGLNYGIQASSHETDQNVNLGFSWKF